MSLRNCLVVNSDENVSDVVRFNKARQMGNYAMVSLWCESLLTNTRFRFNNNNNDFVIIEWTIVAHLMLDQQKELPNDSGRPLSYNNFTDKKQNEAVLFCVFCIELSLHLPLFKVRGLQKTTNFALV